MTFFFLKLSSLQVRYVSGVGEDVGTFISLLPFPEIKGQRTGAPGGLSEAGVFPALWPARGAAGCQRPGEENVEPEGRVGAKLCSLESSPGVRPGGHRVVSVNGAQPLPRLEDPRREARGRTDTGGRATGRKGNCEPPQGPNTERRDRLSPCQHGRLPKRLILSLGLFTITKERHVDFWFSGEMFWMMGLKKKKIICHLLSYSQENKYLEKTAFFSRSS